MPALLSGRRPRGACIVGVTRICKMISFAYSDNSEAVAETLAGFVEAISGQEEGLRQIADDFREMMA